MSMHPCITGLLRRSWRLWSTANFCSLSSLQLSKTNHANAMNAKLKIFNSQSKSKRGAVTRKSEHFNLPTKVNTTRDGLNLINCFCVQFRSLHQETNAFSTTGSVSSTVANLTETFEKEGIPEPDVPAEYIVAYALGIKMLSDFARVEPSRILSAEEVKKVAELASQKMMRMPLQYMLGEWDFRDLTLKMRAPVFIPRPETEMLVDLVVSHYPEDKELNFLEVGCGTGAISLSILHEFDQAHITAIDASEEAVNLTQENAECLGLACRLKTLQLMLTESSIPDILARDGVRYDAIVSNPPYIFSQDMATLDPEVARYEDPSALEAGASGMSVITAIIQQARHLLTPGGMIWLETDLRHHQLIPAWLQDHPETSVQFRGSFVDFSNRPRFCQLEYTP